MPSKRRARSASTATCVAAFGSGTIVVGAMRIALIVLHGVVIESIGLPTLEC